MSISLTIEKLVIGGMGLGHMENGMVVLVPHVLAGERVRVKPVQQKKNFLQARVEEILEASPDRVVPPCPYFFQCGGCDFQHVVPEKQALIKSYILQDEISRLLVSQIKQRDVFTQPLSSPDSFHYRQRVRLQIDNCRMGFYRFRSHEVKEIESCLLARSELNEVLLFLRSDKEFNQLSEQLHSVELLLSPSDNRVISLLHMTRKLRPSDRKRIEKILVDCPLLRTFIVEVDGFGLVGVFHDEQADTPDSMIHFDYVLPWGGTLHMSLEAGGFSQVNMGQNEKLIGLVLDWVNLGSDVRALDLFCGMGNFTLPLARKVKHVKGMDVQRSAIRSAMRNAEENSITNCEFSRNSAAQGARLLRDAGEVFDLVLLDPPRQGCQDVISFLPALKADQVLYISCDPATLCRDLVLLEKSGYMVEKIKMVDMFPQTHHMETIVSLNKARTAPPRR